MSARDGADLSASRGAAWRGQIAVLALVVLGFVLYARGLVLGFVADDLTALDAVLRHPLGELLSGRHAVPGSYRSLSRELYFWWWGQGVGLGPGGFHLVNLLTYAGVVVMIGRLARAWGGPRAGLLAAAAFVLYPPGSALLAWVSCAQDLLALFWAAAALLLYLGGRDRLAGWATALAALSGESALVLPAALAVMDWQLHPRAAWRERFMRLAPSVAGVGVALALTIGLHAAGSLAGATAPWSPQRLADAWRLPLGFVRTFIPPDTGAGIAKALEGQPVWLGLVVVLAVLAVPGPAGGRAVGTPSGTRPLLVFGAALALLGLVPLAFLTDPWRGYSFVLSGLGASLVAGALLADRVPPPFARVVLPLAALINFGAGGLYRARETAAGPIPHPYVNYAFFRDTGAFSDRLLAALEPWCPSLRALPRTFAAGVPPDPAFTSVLGSGLRVTCRDTVTRVRFLADFTADDARTEFGVLRFDARAVRFVHERADARVRARIGEGFLIHARYDVAAACFESAIAGRPPDRELSYPLAVSLAAAGREADARTVWREAERRGAVLDPATMADRLMGRSTAGADTGRREVGWERRPAVSAAPDPLAAAALRAPWEAEPHRALGRALLTSGRAREATLELAVAAGISREMADLAWLGQGFEAIGASQEALAAYRRALESGLRGDLYASTRERFAALARRTGAALDRSQTRP